MRRNYSRKVLVPAVLALLIANTINAGADIGAIAASINLFVPVPITLLVIPVALIILASFAHALEADRNHRVTLY